MPKLRELLYLQLVVSPDNGYLLLVPRNKDLQYAHTFRLDDKQAYATAIRRGLMEEEYFLSIPQEPWSLEATVVHNLHEDHTKHNDTVVYWNDAVQHREVLNILLHRKGR